MSRIEATTFVLFLLLSITGCAHVVSDEMRVRAVKDLDTEAFFREPESFKGKIVVIGGAIVDSRNEKDGSYIEVLQQPLDGRGRPIESDRSAGRFIVYSKGFLDRAIYAPGKRLTVAGTVMGGLAGKIGDMDYVYPLIRAEELHLVKGGGVPIRFSIGIWHVF